MLKYSCLLLAWMSACGADVDSGTPLPAARSATPSQPRACNSSQDCGDGEICVGSMGCDTAWTCVAQSSHLCALEAATFCTCDGETVSGSLSCVGRQIAYVGECDS